MNRKQFIQLGLAATAGAVMLGCASGTQRATGRSNAKRGIGLGTKAGSQWRKTLELSGAQWFYSWNSTPPDKVPAGVEFIPMVWGRRSDDSIAKLGLELRKHRFGTLLGYNEPDQYHQANLTVAEALRQWPRLMQLGVRLGSPACVHPDREWMKAFMKGADERQLRVDFVTVHSYGGLNADALMKRLADVYELYGRPLWLTEFAVGDWQAKTRAENRYRPEQIVEFVQKALPQLDACKYVERYAWFPSNPDSASLGPCALFNADGTLTPVGEAYRGA